ncbi:MAG: hypothetical protein OEQ75_13675 [Gemmatimonadota bacterium]|nr:hypothetical protein [Gemmatimonadota bacterium]
MRNNFPQFEARVNRAGGVDWYGYLQPTPESVCYRVHIRHQPNRDPRVWIEVPRLRKDAPHLYADGSLCLYWPADWRWTPRECLADTIVPWTAFWLYFYELWLVTGDWLGPQSPHLAGQAKERQDDDQS